ncbi:tissue factor-like [Notolabrus celidotus]|uniref:tissue factor-like n=1 Tax=Notolabrus celidotus TaxID=1203425 RepID=UPI00149056F0|nr:tissue factor-like [Notolabrus celidotus]
MLTPTLTLCAALLLLSHSASGSYPRAQNVTWTSTNFKTLLTWQPKPSDSYSYTVEFSVVGGDRQRKSHCIRSTGTDCDLSGSMDDLKACYTADVLSEPPLGVSSDIIEFPYSSSPRFCPYKDTDIGRPDFKLEVSEDKKTTTLYVTDPPTALFLDGRQLNIRDVFSDQLQYKVTYRKDKSSGKKVHISKDSPIKLTDLDRGENYCFSVQAYIPSRDINKQYGEMSIPQCSNDRDKSIFEVYSVGVIAAAIFLSLLLLGLIVAVTVVCCRRRKKALSSGKEGLPLSDINNQA